MMNEKQDPSIEAESTPPIKTRQPSVTALTALILAIFAVILALACAGVGIFYWKTFNNTNEQLQQSQTQINNLQSQNQTDIENLQNDLHAQQQQTQTINKSLEAIAHQSNENGKTRVLNQAAVLLNMADLQLLASRNVTAAARLIQAAKDQVIQLNDPSLVILIKSFDDNLSALHASQADVTNNMLLLNQISRKIQSISLSPKNLITPIQTIKHIDNPQAHWYQRWLQYLGAALKSVVIIKHSMGNTIPIVSSDQELLIKQNIQMKINFAQWALIYQNQSLYVASLNQVLNWVSQYFPNSGTQQGIIMSLKSMLLVQVPPTLPQLKNSLRIIDQLISNSLPSERQTGAINTTPHNEQSAPQSTQPQNITPIPNKNSIPTPPNNTQQISTQVKEPKITGVFI